MHQTKPNWWEKGANVSVISNERKYLWENLFEVHFELLVWPTWYIWGGGVFKLYCSPPPGGEWDVLASNFYRLSMWSVNRWKCTVQFSPPGDTYEHVIAVKEFFLSISSLLSVLCWRKKRATKLQNYRNIANSVATELINLKIILLNLKFSL